MVVTGVPAAVVTAATGAPTVAPVLGWGVACAAYVASVWFVVRSLDAEGTRSHALSEDPSRQFSETSLLLATVVSLAAVVTLLLAGDSERLNRVYAALALLSVAFSWLLIHTIFMLRYAAAYYGDRAGGIDFNSSEPPRYGDFAYVAFTVGMTYQIADTDLQSSALRSVALRHALLSYLFGTVIVVTAINLALSLVR